MQGSAGAGRRSPSAPERAYRCAAAVIRSTIRGASSTTLGGLPMASTVPTTPATLRVTVTEHDIRSGQRRSCTDCPIALALRRACPDAAVVQVGQWSATVGSSRFWLPNDAQLFVRAFDHSRAVLPFSFELVAQ